MTSAVLLAALAGCAGAAGVVELAGARREKSERARRLTVALARLGRRVGAPLPTRDAAARLEAAGRPLRLSAGDLAAVKAGAAVVALLAGAPVAASLPGRLAALAALASPVAGFVAPDLLLARRASRRTARMEADLPALLDLLRVAVEAGLPVSAALAEVGRRHGGTLAREWQVAAAEMELGVAHDDALARLARRCPLPAIAALTTAIRRAERHGAPLASTLASQAAEARALRARRIRERAARAGPKIQLVVALLLVPSVLLLVAAALVASLLR